MKHVFFRVAAGLAFLPERLSMVRKFTNRLLPAITMIFCASPASAEIRTLARAGGWEAYVSVNEGGDLLCGILQFNDPYAFMIKYSPINDAGFVHLRKATWKVPNNAEMQVQFLVDGQVAWSEHFTGTSDPTMIEGKLSGADAARFIGQFAYGKNLTISFASGSEGDWRGSLRGTLAVTREFVNCMEQTSTYAKNSSTQPYAAEPNSPSQPSSGRPFRTQPSGRTPNPDTQIY